MLVDCLFCLASELVSGRLIRSLSGKTVDTKAVISLLGLAPREVEVIRWSATDKTYKEIAEEMCISPHTVDGYRDDLFGKLKVKSRVGIVLFGLKHGIIKLDGL